MRDLLKMMQTGLDMGGTDHSYYARKGDGGQRRAQKPVPGGLQRSAFSDEKAVLARWFRQQGHTWKWIADQLGCNESTVRRRLGR